MNKPLIKNLLTVIAFLSLCSPVFASFSIAPALGTDLTSIGLDAGESTKGEIEIKNASPDKGDFIIYAVDSIRNQQGLLSPKSINEDQVAAGSWVKLEKEEVSLEANQDTAIPFTITAPSRISPGTYQGFFLLKKTNLGTSTGVSFATSTAYPFKVTILGEINADFQMNFFNYNEQGSVLSYEVENKGNTSIATETTITITSSLGFPPREIKVPDLELFMDEKVSKTHILSPPLLGDYTVSLEMKYFKNDLITKEKEYIGIIKESVTIDRPITLIIVTALAVLLIAVLSVIFLKKKDEKPA